MPHLAPSFEDYIQPLNLGGMNGRMLHLPAPAKAKNNEILFIYGQRSSLEVWYEMAAALNRYGAVTMPDLPGFGGMASLFSVNHQPTLDNLADYLATFVRWRYKRKKVVVIGYGFGFVVVTRMLANYPQLQKSVKLVVSLAGYSHYSDFNISKKRYQFRYQSAAALKYQPLSFLYRTFALNKTTLKRHYNRNYEISDKSLPPDEKARIAAAIASEMRSWRNNDARTWLFTNHEILKLDNCARPVNLPLWHVYVESDRAFDEHRVEQHLRVIFSDFHRAKANLPPDSSNALSDLKSPTRMLPPTIRWVLRDL